jgi:hypothetical protein
MQYQAVAPGRVVDLIRDLRVDTSNFTFVDLGSGQGPSSALVAARFPFRSVNRSGVRERIASTSC